MADQALINGLNEQLNREVSTFLRYMLQGASIKGAEHEPIREMYLSEVTDEVGHAQEWRIRSFAWAVHRSLIQT